MKKSLLGIAAATAILASVPAFAATTPLSMPKFDHVFVIMMENHSESEILGNANAPYMTSLAAANSQATNYFGVGHPSAPNYLEMMGGSNFGLNNDVWPAWINGGCVDNSPSGSGCGGAVPALSGTVSEVAIPATATEANGSCNGQLDLVGVTPVANNCAARDYAAETITAQTIADQLVAKGMTWKAYEESLPTQGSRVDGVNYSDGTWSSLTPASFYTSNSPTPAIPKLYAVKHNPFVYFAAVQQGTNPNLSENQIQDFDGNDGLWADLARSTVPNFAFIAPNQCHDVHMVGGGENTCTENNPSITVGDQTVKKLVTAITSAKFWGGGHNAIIITFDENDYANTPNVVPFIVVKNYGPTGVSSNVVYDHYSALKTLETGFGLPCLNHACDATSKLMLDVFGDNR